MMAVKISGSLLLFFKTKIHFMKNNSINRRDFLKNSAKAAAAGVLLFSSGDILKLVASSKEPGDYKSTEEKIINLSDYPSLSKTGGYAMITDKVIVIRKSASKFIAINIACTHKKCDVGYDGSGFECLCHGSTFDSSGKVTQGPAVKNLKTYKTVYNSEDNTLKINM